MMGGPLEGGKRRRKKGVEIFSAYGDAKTTAERKTLLGKYMFDVAVAFSLQENVFLVYGVRR